jgi:hypothetical protein
MGVGVVKAVCYIIESPWEVMRVHDAHHAARDHWRNK